MIKIRFNIQNIKRVTYYIKKEKLFCFLVLLAFGPSHHSAVALLISKNSSKTTPFEKLLKNHFFLYGIMIRSREMLIFFSLLGMVSCVTMVIDLFVYGVFIHSLITYFT